MNGTSFPSITIIVDNVPELRALLLESRKPFRLVKQMGENEFEKLNENTEIIKKKKKYKGICHKVAKMCPKCTVSLWDFWNSKD